MRDMCDLSDTRVSDTSDTAATSVGAIERCLQHVEMSAGWSNYEPQMREMLADLTAARDELAMLRAKPEPVEGHWAFGWYQVPANPVSSPGEAGGRQETAIGEVG